VGWTADGVLRIRVTAPPVDNKANRELIRFLAGQLGVSRSELALAAGASSRRKRLHAPASCKNRLSSFPDI